MWIELGLEITNIINLLIAMTIEKTRDPKYLLMTLQYNFSFILYTLSHWVFVRQYYKVSLFVPYVLKSKDEAQGVLTIESVKETHA